MAKAVAKLFRERQQAEKVINKLKAKGYQAGEVGILIQEKGDGDTFAPDIVPVAKGISFPGVSAVIAKGAVAAAMAGGSEPRAALTELWGVPEQTMSYYQSGLSLGGIVISVHAEGARLQQARQLLREAGAKPLTERRPKWASCPPFDVASRMSETNPIDAPMTGDFRRY
jgi:hypothetical protein